MVLGGIVYAAWYLGYHMGYELTLEKLTGETNRSRWNVTELAIDIKENRQVSNINWDEFTHENLAEVIEDESFIKKGAGIFANKCAPCHGNDAQGVVGPNLNDKFWIYGGTNKDIYESLMSGRPNGMPAWEKDIGKEKVVWAVAFVNSIRGRQVANPKAAEGKEYTGE